MQGQIPVEVQVPGSEGRTYSGSVTRTSESINQQARTMRVEVDIPNGQQSLVPGMYVKVGFGLQPKGLVQVPAAALIFRASGPQVARVDKNNHISFRSVTIARDDGNAVELGSGVEPGDELALNVSAQIGDGELVQVNRAEQRAEPPRGQQQSATTQADPPAPSRASRVTHRVGTHRRASRITCWTSRQPPQSLPPARSTGTRRLGSPPQH
jgi:hypothetical protein